MTDLSTFNPTGRFTGLAEVYARHRPGYPVEALDFIQGHCGLGPGAVVVDVGCGTGISTRLLAARGLRVIGVDPNADMRARAEAEPPPPGVTVPVYRDGRAEATGLPAGSADAVLAAQAFHWFQAEPALREFHHILQPGGWVVLLWNERDESDPFTAAYGEAFRATPGAAALEMARGRAGEALLVSPWFTDQQRVVFRSRQELDEEGLLGRAFSASYAPREPVQAEAFTAALRRIFAVYQRQGRVVLCYETAVYVGRAAPAVPPPC